MHAHRHFLFTAALVVLSNEFAGLCDNSQYSSSIFYAVNLLKYCVMY